MTGAEIEAVLAQQFRADRNSILQISEGSSFAWRSAPDAGEPLFTLVPVHAEIR